MAVIFADGMEMVDPKDIQWVETSEPAHETVVLELEFSDGSGVNFIIPAGHIKITIDLETKSISFKRKDIPRSNHEKQSP